MSLTSTRITLRTILKPPHFLPSRPLVIHRRPINNMSNPTANQQPQAQAQGQGWLWNKLGYEDLPQDVKTKGFYDLEADLPGGKRLRMEDHKDKVVLIVNTASQCGFTPQYTALQALHNQYKDQGLVVLGFPCDQFGGQEPGSDEDIASFCQLNHGVDFKLVKKSDVNGPKQNSIFAWLKQQEHGKGLMGTSVVKWNFEKFLVDRKGQVVGRWASLTKPEKLKEEIEKALAQTV